MMITKICEMKKKKAIHKNSADRRTGVKKKSALRDIKRNYPFYFSVPWRKQASIGDGYRCVGLVIIQAQNASILQEFTYMLTIKAGWDIHESLF